MLQEDRTTLPIAPFGSYLKLGELVSLWKFHLRAGGRRKRERGRESLFRLCHLFFLSVFVWFGHPVDECLLNYVDCTVHAGREQPGKKSGANALVEKHSMNFRVREG